MFCLHVPALGLRRLPSLLVSLLLVALMAGCSGNSQGANGSTGTAGGGNVPTLGTGGAASGATSGVAAGGIGNPTRPAAPVPGASPSSPATQTITVSLTSANQFQPASIDVPRGGTVVWTNTAQTNHTVTDDPNKAANKSDAALPQGAQTWDAGQIGPGATFSHIFDTPGQYTYFCAIHEAQGMVARITVSG